MRHNASAYKPVHWRTEEKVMATLRSYLVPWYVILWQDGLKLALPAGLDHTSSSS
jgi:hypothetical protein